MALLSSLFYGIADFQSGRLTRLVPVVIVAGMTALASISFFVVGGVVGFDVEVVGSDLLVGTILGCIYTTANLLLFSALATGPMGVVSATSGAAISIPLLFDVFTGRAPSWAQLVGIAGVSVGVLLVSRKGTAGEFHVKVLLMGLGAAALYGTANVVIKFGTHSNIYGLFLVAETVEVVIYGLLALAMGLRAKLTVQTLAILFSLGLLNSTGQVIFGYAARAGRIDIVAILGSLGPVVVVALAFAVLHERLGRLQTFGFFVAALASLFLV